MPKFDANDDDDDHVHVENAAATAAACSSSPARPTTAQPHLTNDDDHHSHVIDIDAAAAAAAGGRRSCAVCMETLEWAAIGPCGHGEVCAGCALHIRVFQNNRLCCICRSPCRVVVVTRRRLARRLLAATEVADRWRVEGRVGEYWYHAGMEAFFDDERQYEAAKAAAQLGPPPPPPPQPSGDANENPPPPPPPLRTGVGNSDGRRARRDPPDQQCDGTAIGLFGLFIIGVFFVAGISNDDVAYMET
uniref:RING-type domain-containing protein n=1 Tax=Oryza rufipogon TaxID=4529 RepID=A0A0E0QBM9_ORYRU